MPGIIILSKNCRHGCEFDAAPNDPLPRDSAFTGLTLSRPPSRYKTPQRAQDKGFVNQNFLMRKSVPNQKNSPMTEALSTAKFLTPT
jgi:hypothetical protein